MSENEKTRIQLREQELRRRAKGAKGIEFAPYNPYQRVGELPISRVLPLLIPYERFVPGEKDLHRILLDGYQVNVKSLRLTTFLQKGTDCVRCGRRGIFFAIERSKGVRRGQLLTVKRHLNRLKKAEIKEAYEMSFHLNLYGVDVSGQESLMTHDHILARSLGGEDVIENAQTMCCKCNQKKAMLEQVAGKLRGEERREYIRNHLVKPQRSSSLIITAGI